MPDPLTFFDDPTLLAPRRALRQDLPGGAFVLRSPDPLGSVARCTGEWLERWARETPDAIAFAEPAPGGGWVELNWRELRRRTGAVAQALIDLALPVGAPVVVLSDNSLDHLVLELACQHIGRAICPVTSSYSRLAQGDYGRIHGILAALEPALVYAHDAATYAPVLARAPVKAPLVFSHGAASVAGSLTFADLLTTRETAAVMAAFAALTPDTHAKYLLTSGSTGHPKVVINTQRMLTTNQQMLAQTLRFLAREKPLLLDWLPWSHTFGGNHNKFIVLCTGGTMFIDDGRPMPGLIDRTIAHLRELQPTLHFNVPRGYDMMLPAFEADESLARRFFGKLRMLFYAGAGMPQATWQRLEAVAARVRDVRTNPVWFTTSWGSTETAPANTFAHWKLERAGVIGLPMPGCEIKFVPNAGKLEMRLRGAHIFPGYRNNEAATREAFDEEGYYRIGDAGYLEDPADPVSGIVFDGRVAEDFKLTSGTWVSVGTLRLHLVTALAPLAQDAVITGHDRDEVGALVFLTEPARKLPPEEVREAIRAALQRLRAERAGSAATPARVLLLSDAPSMAAGEITDKGYVNQRLTLQRRAAEVELLYGPPADARIITAA
jgi:feruloyl-CoA synthase